MQGLRLQLQRTPGEEDMGPELLGPLSDSWFGRKEELGVEDSQESISYARDLETRMLGPLGAQVLRSSSPLSPFPSAGRLGWGKRCTNS